MIKDTIIINEKDEIYFIEESTKQRILFGIIDEYGISFNIQKIRTLTGFEEIIPNPPLSFYIELGKKLKERLN